jgi:hypothetical protein
VIFDPGCLSPGGHRSTIHSDRDVYTEYIDPARDEWVTVILPALKAIPLVQLVNETGLSRRTLIDLRAGRSRPHPRNRKLLEEHIRGTCAEV